MSETTSRPRGRFAPSPTGPLHFGSLVAATGSFLGARSQGGEWLVRMEDLDPPRAMQGAADDILRTLEAYGFEWEGPVLYQSRRRDAYETALDTLKHHGVVYACGCTRREIADSSVHGIEGPVYPGTCRKGLPPGREARALRVHTEGARCEFTDRIQGVQRSALDVEVGDFVVKRADGFFAYQLAVVVDDAEQGITEVVRGADLLASTARQIHLQRLLGVTRPQYAHLPAVLSAPGIKLSKQTGASALPARDRVGVLWRVLEYLGQTPPPEWKSLSIAEFWAGALQRWSEARVPRHAGRVMNEPGAPA
jgi:glutamyl-Q tRNA(Asp) synthetase